MDATASCIPSTFKCGSLAQFRINVGCVDISIVVWDMNSEFIQFLMIMYLILEFSWGHRGAPRSKFGRPYTPILYQRSTLLPLSKVSRLSKSSEHSGVLSSQILRFLEFRNCPGFGSLRVCGRWILDNVVPTSISNRLRLCVK